MAVVQAGTMGKAAQGLNTTQPNISRSMSEFEHALGADEVSGTAHFDPELKIM